MSKVEIHNEIIQLRHAVRQARVCVVNKLIREAKLLRNRYGNESQKEKYKRKADKLIAEVYAIKKIKDDDIFKFGIINEKDLPTILQDESLSHNDRVMARVAHYKTLNRRLEQFKEKFPDCKKYIVEGKKKNVKSKSKGATKTKKSLKENPQLQTKSSEKNKTDSYENIEHSQSNSKEEECNTESIDNSLEAIDNLHKCKKSLNKDCIPLKKEKKLKLVKNIGLEEDTIIHKQPNVIEPCSVTKEATVKRFTKLLEEQESSTNVEMSIKIPDSATEQATKMLDDFFVTEDNQDSQRSAIGASTSHVKSYKPPIKTFRSSNRIKKQNIKYRNDKPSFSKKSDNRTPNKINKDSNNRNSNNINNKEENIDLHPSWSAKRKQQKIMAQGFQGKKTVFGDD
ncbi:serum response factor-binding protein 1-like [Nylanderia fulva]|uniref:serum response factor-binding protein 1-like n=1 Tax=Nylanderia fulva TaxID=613905 RepID=UPI0010FAD1E6|nr:serum response factor-binding protein 1-like [Nylanderia fulva]